MLLTNVDNVALLVYHNVPIVSILELQEVTDKRVGGHADDEVITSLQKHTTQNWKSEPVQI